MCGILVYIGREEIDRNFVARLNDSQRHRGPDDSGIWLKKNIALAMVRGEQTEIGTRAIVDTFAESRNCKVVPKPFYDPKKLIVAQT